MADFILRDFDPDRFRADIVEEIKASLEPLLAQLNKPPKTIANRKEMAELLGWSLAKLDKRTKDKAIPSMMDGDHRMFVIADVFQAIEVGTSEAEKLASERQAAKHAAKKNNGKSR